MSFKNKLILTNAMGLIIFVFLLIYSTVNFVKKTSHDQFQQIKENITGHNQKLLLTFVKSQSFGLDKEIELVIEHIKHTKDNFSFKSSSVGKNEKLYYEELALINSKKREFINEAYLIDLSLDKMYSLLDGELLVTKQDFDIENMILYKNLYIHKKSNRKKVSSFSIYIRLERFPTMLLKFDLNLEYFSRSLTLRNMDDELINKYFIVDDSGRYIASNLKLNSNELMEEGVVLDEQTKKNVAKQIMSNNVGCFLVAGSSGNLNVTFIKNEKTGWRIVVVTPEHIIRSSYITTKELVLSGDSMLIESLLWASVVLLGLFLLINSFTMNKVLYPISQLIEQANFLKKRDFSNATILVKSNGDEIEQLSRAYCEAGIQIRDLILGLEKEVENRTRQYEVAAEKAREASEQKSLLLSNVSHEIRTPLNAIIGYTYMLTHSQFFDSYRHQLNGISSASNTILSIVNDLLDFERIKTTHYSLTAKRVLIGDFVRNIEETFLPISDTKKLALNVLCKVDPFSYLITDELRLKQAINNVVSNAFKFTKQGGVTIEFTSNPKEQSFCITVVDSGVGIPSDKIDTIFNGFEQVNQEDQQSGFGLGLTITKTIIELMKGTLSVESKLNVGSKFIIQVPITALDDVLDNAASSGYEEKYSQNLIDCAGRKALIVDDVEFNREILEFHLNNLGFECEFAVNGYDALSIIKKCYFDLVFTDISMPVMDGVQLAREVKKFKPKLPIVAVTARATIEEKDTMNHHFQCYLTKPINLNDLKAKIQCALLGGCC
ncbi:hybrid sensor histidine kinase/response regulator [Vibrio tasmaniensis]|nr:hybrid sensor histidine kinase/response regulator [Vibrio tasmaniensis]